MNSVEFIGPPGGGPVIRNADVNTWNDPMIPMIRLKRIEGESIGRVTCRNRAQPPAPSIFAAS